jgi:vitamin B12 transporter
MVNSHQSSAYAVAAFLIAAALPNPARAQESAALPEITVTADRVEEPVNSTGSSVTVIPGSQLAQWGPQGVTEVLRDVAGVEVNQTAGPGSATEVRLRGANPGQALVLIDGVPVGNVAGTDGSLDFGNLSAIDIERIEILRGPQTALYGSDAMSGVINIITKKGKAGKPVRTATVEAGSYGTVTARTSISGAADAWTYSLGATATHSDSFTSYGYRVDRPLTIGDGVTPLPALPDSEPVNKGAVNGRFTYTLSPTSSVDFGFNAFGNGLQFANPFAFIPADVFSSYNLSRAYVGDAFVRANFAAFDGVLTSHLGVFTSATVNSVDEAEGCFDAYFNPFNCNTTYHGSRWGAEYQGELGLNRWGSLIFGARSMAEYASQTQSPDPGDGSFSPIDAEQTTNSAYAEYRLPLLTRLDFTLGGRVDSIVNGSTFDTGRATVAYHIDETGTKLRAAFGNAAKAPTLYQRYSLFGDPNLLPETNVGGEVGIDQKLFNDRLTLSATAFDAYYKDLINFADVPSCTTAQLAAGAGCYYNVGSARISGVELSAEATLLPGLLRARGTYTYLDAQNLQTNTQLLRIPHNAGTISVVWNPMANLEIEPRLILVGQALDYATVGNVTLPGYARIDVIASYKVNDTFTAYVRVENLTNTNYEQVYNYGSPGRSAYAGLTAKF